MYVKIIGLVWYKATMGLFYGFKEMKIDSKKGIWK